MRVLGCVIGVLGIFSVIAWAVTCAFLYDDGHLVAASILFTVGGVLILGTIAFITKQLA